MNFYEPKTSYRIFLNTKKFELKKAFFRISQKSLALLFIFVLTTVSFSQAFIFDREESVGNTFATSTLDMELTPENPDFSPQPLMPKNTTTQNALVTNSGNSDFAYSQEITNTSGSSQLCQSLNLKVYYQYYDDLGVLQKIEKFNGLLTNFALNTLSPDSQMQIPNLLAYYSNSDYGENQHWYSYEVSLPNNPDPSLGNKTCSFDILAKVWQPELSYSQGFTDEEFFSASISTGSWAKVSGIKFENENSNNQKDSGEPGIENWDIYAAQEIEKFSVNSNGTTINSQALENGEKYLIRAKGTFSAGDNITADAKYSVRAPSTSWTDTVENYESYGPQLLDLQIDSASPDWGEYNDNHEYWLSYDGLGLPLTFFINDIYYPNNSGSLEVTIFKIVSQVKTDTNGYYEIDLTDITGEFIIAEEPQSGWIQTYPESGFYSFTVPGFYEDIDFGNTQSQTQDIDKIVINEVYQDSTNSQEWVELYNAGTNSVSLNNWTIEDGAGSDTLGDYILDSGEFAVIVTNGASQDILNEIITNSAILIQLDNATIGAGLNTNGDLLYLKNASAEIQDSLSWGDNKTVFDMNNISTDHSIARHPLGFDTDQATDWQDNPLPNPGTNPHSHIQVSVNQEDNNLIIGFSNAYGFNSLDYSISYQRYSGTYLLEENISGQSGKNLDQKIFTLTPFYFGTCSSQGSVCIPHQIVGPIKISLLYKNGQQILGNHEITYLFK